MLAESVAQFLVSYRKLKDCSDDDPDALDRDMRTDEGLKNLCRDVWRAAFRLEQSERRERRAFTAPVNQKFIEEWRDYKRRFEGVVSLAMLLDLGVEVGATSKVAVDQFELRWNYAHDQAVEDAAAIERAIAHAEIDITNMGIASALVGIITSST